MQPLIDDSILTHGKPAFKNMDHSNKIKEYVVKDAEEALEESFDKFIQYVMQTTHFSWWPKIKRCSSKITQEDKVSLPQFAKKKPNFCSMLETSWLDDG